MLVTRALLLGLAAGSRASLGVAGPILRSGVGGPATVLATGAVLGELVVDQLPTTPDRTDPGPLLGRLGSGVAGGVLLARSAGEPVALPALAGGAGAAAGAVLGAGWREGAGQVMGDPAAALVEDVVALALAWWACR